MAPPHKTVAQYEAEAITDGKCLIHPSYGVARKVYILRHGALPSNIAVCHTCDNPKCIQEVHHFTGTWRDNVVDAVNKGRHSCFNNCAKPGEPFRGGPHTDNVKRKIGNASKMLWDSYTPEQRAVRISKSLLGRGLHAK